MTDQVRKLSSKGLSATLLGSTQRKKNVLQEVETGLYLQSFYSKQRKKPIDVFLNMATSNRIYPIAVDEVHLYVTLGIMLGITKSLLYIIVEKFIKTVILPLYNYV